MKQYKIILQDKREEFVVADTYQCVDHEYHFFIGGSAIPDVFFKEDWVLGITVDCENYEEASKPARYRFR